MSARDAEVKRLGQELAACEVRVSGAIRLAETHKALLAEKQRQLQERLALPTDPAAALTEAVALVVDGDQYREELRQLQEEDDAAD